MVRSILAKTLQGHKSEERQRYKRRRPCGGRGRLLLVSEALGPFSPASSSSSWYSFCWREHQQQSFWDFPSSTHHQE